MNGITSIYLALKADAPTMALLSTRNGDKTITDSQPEPDTWEITDSTISLYQAGIRDYTLDYLDNTITANCRSGTSQEALSIAAAVATALNRNKVDGGGRFYCSLLPTIPPVDPETDSYNVPVEIQIKGQSALT